jgi:hypothetical protein
VCVGNRAPTARSQAGAPLSWTSDGADTTFVCERARKAAANKRQPQRATASNGYEASGGVLPSASDDDDGGFSMFAPPICRRS